VRCNCIQFLDSPDVAVLHGCSEGALHVARTCWIAGDPARSDTASGIGASRSTVVHARRVRHLHISASVVGRAIELECVISHTDLRAVVRRALERRRSRYCEHAQAIRPTTRLHIVPRADHITASIAREQRAAVDEAVSAVAFISILSPSVEISLRGTEAATVLQRHVGRCGRRGTEGAPAGTLAVTTHIHTSGGGRRSSSWCSECGGGESVIVDREETGTAADFL